MKLHVISIGLVLLFSACKPVERNPADSYQRWTDQMIVRLGLPNVGIWPCGQKERLPPEQCFKLDPPRRWQGVWVTEFEGERFCPGATRPCAYESKPSVALYWNRATFPGQPQVLADVDKSYKIDFIGRRASFDGWYNLRDQFIVVDRLISMTDQGPLQKK